MADRRITEAFNDFVLIREENIALVESINKSDLMTIPTGLNNNIFWQAGHLVAVGASLLFKHINQPVMIDTDWFGYFSKGTSVNDFDDTIPSFDIINNKLHEQIKDIKSSISSCENLSYNSPVTVSTGHLLKTFSDAISFLPYHEAYHFGSMKSIKILLEN